jgi:hypothetical protein
MREGLFAEYANLFLRPVSGCLISKVRNLVEGYPWKVSGHTGVNFIAD